MTRYARYEGDTVAEVIDTDGDISKMFHESLRWVPCPDAVRPGWRLKNGQAAPPDPVTQTAPVPVVSPRQARLALLARGRLSEVEAFIADAPKAVQIAWQYAEAIERSSPLVQSLAEAMGLTAADLDSLFIEAIQL